NAPAHIEVKAHEVRPDAAHPEASSGVLQASIEVGDVLAALDVTKEADAIDFALRLTARSLGAARPFLTPELISTAPWDRMALAVRSSGHVEHLFGATPSIRQSTEVDVDRFAFRNVAAQSLALRLKSQGTALQHQADVDLRLPGLTFDGGNPGDDHLTLSAT